MNNPVPASFDIPAIAKEAVGKVIVPLLRDFLLMNMDKVELLVRAQLEYMVNAGKLHTVNCAVIIAEELMKEFEPDPKVRQWISKTTHYRESFDAIRQTVCDKYQQHILK